MKRDLRGMTLPEVAEALKAMGQPAFRAKQLYTWLHKGAGYEDMTNIPKTLREALAAEYDLYRPTPVRRQESARDGTIKYLWQLSDGNCVETVLMRYHYGNTVCISTEVGCRMGCAFCASTLGGLVRRLEPFEMLDQVLFTQVDSGQPISHIVLMGIGEPLDNFDNVMRFLELVNSPEGMNISMRHISLSTCGLVPKIDELAKRNLQLTLSVSLHAPNDAVRDTIMPVNKAYPSQELIDACRRYYEATSRRISFEYAMIDGVNDSAEQAELLARRVKPLSAHVNLIPLNHVDERHFSPSTPENMRRFVEILEKNGVNVTVRRRLGSDVDASCGQLRRKSMEGKI